MRRREFITFVGSAAAWPFAASAQQPAQMRRIGVLMGLDANDPESQAAVTALKRGLQELGWTEGSNLETKYNWTGGAPDRVQSSAKELVERQCEVIVARSTLMVAALLKETQTIPIVFVVVLDPIGSGFIQSFARPGGNVTGFQSYEFTMVGKWAQILKEIAPQVQRVAFVYNPTTVPPGFLRAMETLVPPNSLQIVKAPVHDSAEIDAALTALAREPGGGFVVLPDGFMIANRAQVIELAAQHRLPAVYTSNLWTTSHGLLAYGPDTSNIFYRAASYVDRILKGEKPGDLPVQAPKYELVINLKTANALGLTIPRQLQQIADEVIE
jgi:putative ABC transport system substrate-binding protein